MNRRAEGHGPLAMILDLASRTRNLSAGGLALALALLSSACGRGSSRTASTLTIHYQSDEWLFGPGYDDDPKMLVFPPLVRWHDGAPVTAQDVAFTYSLWRHPDVRYYAGRMCTGASP